MKALVFLLVLGNLLFYAFSAGYFGTPDNPDAGRILQQVKPENIRIVSRGEPPAPSEPVPPPPAVEPEPAAVEPDKEAAAPVAAAPFCLAWQGAGAAEATRLAEMLARDHADVRLDGAEDNGWWVLIPPLTDKASADKKAGELRALGVEDYFAIQEGPNRHAISLGVFSTEKGALERLTVLKGKGVRSARLLPRPGKDGGMRLTVRGPADQRSALESSLARLFPGRKAPDCP